MQTKKELVQRLMDGNVTESELISEVESRQPYIVWNGYFTDVFGKKHKYIGQEQHRGHHIITFGNNSKK